ncbi:hypothetical protein D3C78_1731430 [compost metagenome]
MLLGLLLAKGLAQAAQAPQHATSLRLLLGAALGTGLSAVAIVLGLQGWLPLLALLAATPSRGTHVA